MEGCEVVRVCGVWEVKDTWNGYVRVWVCGAEKMSVIL